MFGPGEISIGNSFYDVGEAIDLYSTWTSQHRRAPLIVLGVIACNAIDFRSEPPQFDARKSERPGVAIPDRDFYSGQYLDQRISRVTQATTMGKTTSAIAQAIAVFAGRLDGRIFDETPQRVGDEFDRGYRRGANTTTKTIAAELRVILEKHNG